MGRNKRRGVGWREEFSRVDWINRWDWQAQRRRRRQKQWRGVGKSEQRSRVKLRPTRARLRTSLASSLLQSARIHFINWIVKDVKVNVGSAPLFNRVTRKPPPRRTVQGAMQRQVQPRQSVNKVSGIAKAALYASDCD